MAALTTLADVKTFCSITTLAEDTLLNLLITQVSSAIEEYCGRTFGQATYTEYYKGNGSGFIVLNQRPVISITSIYLDDYGYWGQASGSFSSTTLLVQGTDYAMDVDQPDGSSRSGKVYNINGYWPIPFTYSVGLISPWWGPAVGNIQTSYIAGYSSVPTQIELAANLAISRIRQMAQYGTALSHESYQEYSYSLASNPHFIFSPEVTSILARYRTPAIA